MVVAVMNDVAVVLIRGRHNHLFFYFSTTTIAHWDLSSRSGPGHTPSTSCRSHTRGKSALRMGTLHRSDADTEDNDIWHKTSSASI